jgi:hypothetical protein
MKLNGTHQLFAYADDVNLLGDNIDTIKKNKENVIDASKQVGLDINVEKTKYMLLSRHQNAGQNRDIKIANQIVRKCITVQIFGVNSGNACYHSVQNLLSSRLLSKT